MPLSSVSSSRSGAGPGSQTSRAVRMKLLEARMEREVPSEPIETGPNETGQGGSRANGTGATNPMPPGLAQALARSAGHTIKASKHPVAPPRFRPPPPPPPPPPQSDSAHLWPRRTPATAAVSIPAMSLGTHPMRLASLPSGGEAPRSHRKRFSKEEDSVIIAGVQRFGKDWDRIVSENNLDRSAKQISQRYKRIEKAQASPANSRKRSRSQSTSGTKDGGSGNKDSRGGSPKRARGLDSAHTSPPGSANDDSAAAVAMLTRTVADLETSLKASEAREARMRSVLVDMLARQTRDGMFEERRRLRDAEARLGRIIRERHGHQVLETWQDGFAFMDLKMRLSQLEQRKQELEGERRRLGKRKSKARGGSLTGAAAQDPHVAAHVAAAHEEVLRLELQRVKKAEAALFQEKERLDGEKHVLIRDLRRVDDEDNSLFNQQQILSQRYMLLTLLGKGGFSEVYKAFDLVNLEFVACKIHQLSPHWSDAKKSNYTRHAIREYQIHHELKHPNVVQLMDVFEIDSNSFCTVLELCDGSDLDELLKREKRVSERVARSIIIQVVSALDYINRRDQPVIHYDLKPANILFDKHGLAKITDFGLSKIMDSDTSNLELTSQGAGTYWYLPPECFVIGPNPPTISSKVDVWALGVLFFQMMYGRKPFGNDLSQKNILNDRIIINARSVVFPPKPSVSDGAKNFIRRCLQYNQASRPGVLELAADPYLQSKRNLSKSIASTAVAPAPALTPAATNPTV